MVNTGRLVEVRHSARKDSQSPNVVPVGLNTTTCATGTTKTPPATRSSRGTPQRLDGLGMLTLQHVNDTCYSAAREGSTLRTTSDPHSGPRDRRDSKLELPTRDVAAVRSSSFANPSKPTQARFGDVTPFSGVSTARTHACTVGQTNRLGGGRWDAGCVGGGPPARWVSEPGR